MTDITPVPILYLPFDENLSETTAFDYSPSNAHASIVAPACVVSGGKVGNCLDLGGTGGVNIPSSVSIDPASDFAVSLWINPGQDLSSSDFDPMRLSILFQSPSPSLRTLSIPPEWSHLAISKSHLNIDIFINAQLAESFSLLCQPSFVSLSQDETNFNKTFAQVDELRLFNLPLSQAQVFSIFGQASHKLRYLIDGIDPMKRWGIRFSSSTGLLARPKLKPLTKFDWPDYHGEVVDLTGKRVDARTITLKGWMPANNKTDFIQKWNEFLSIFDKDGTQRLMVDAHPTKPLVYEVYLEDEMDTDKKWSDSAMVGTFTLKLKEPDPVKRVVRQLVTSTSADSRNLRIQMTSQKAVTIYWGDGTINEDLNGTIDITHQYPEGAATYYAIIGGVIEDITNFSTTGIVVWNKI